MDQGRLRNEERRRAQHRMDLETAQEARLRQAQDLALGLSALDLASNSTPETGALREQVIGNVAPGYLPAASAQMRGGAAPAQPGVTPSPGAASAPLGGLIRGAGMAPQGVPGSPSPRSQASPQPVYGPPPAPPKLSVTTPTAAADSAAPAPSGRPAGMAKGLPAGEFGYGSAEARRGAEMADAEHQSKLLALDLGRKAFEAQRLYGDGVAASAIRFMNDRFGSTQKALNADPTDFNAALFEFKSQLYEKGMTPEQVNGYLSDLTSAYAQQMNLKAKRIEASAKATDDERLWLAAKTREQGAFKQHVAESLGLRFSIDPNFNVIMQGMTADDPRLVAYNDIVDRNIDRVTIGQSGIAVAAEALRAMQGQAGGPQMSSGLVPYAPESVDSSLNRGMTPTWADGTKMVKDPQSGSIYTIKPNGDVELYEAAIPPDTGEIE